MTSVTLLVIISVVSAIQLFGFGFQFAFLLAFIGRAIYLGRLVGINLSLTYSLVVEAFAFLWLIVSPILLQREFGKVEFVVYLIIFIIVSLIEWYNDNSYIEEDISEEEYQRILYKAKVLGDETYGRVIKQNSKNSQKTRRTNKRNVSNGDRIRRRK